MSSSQSPSLPVTLTELESHLWEAANILRGSPVDRADWKSYILPLLFFKRVCDAWDEERAAMLGQYGEDFADEHRFQVPDGCHWNAVRAAPKNVDTALANAMRGIEAANQKHLYGVFGDAQWTNKDRLPDELLKDLIKQFADATNKKAGEFYTARSVVRLMVEILDPKEGETIYDPACGTGSMLLAAVVHCREHGGDTLRNPVFTDPSTGGLATFDVVIANPPFSLAQWGRELWENDPWGRAFAGVPTDSNADMAWVQHMVKSMAARTGRMAVVLPQGALFRRGIEGQIRKYLLEHDLKVLIVDASGLFRKGRAQNFMEREHGAQILSYVQNFADVQDHARVVSIKDIEQEGWTLNISRYVLPPIGADIPPLSEAVAAFKDALATCRKAEDELRRVMIDGGWLS